ncbi:hypothetical protein KFE25_008785 [Diacronema lutheri]|uniref:Uncharacterized protein n=1 Tax=Diacronema lutheri TaxID=2081491 RepID=A0A8J6CF61_DIALT|nr:hypothetical protein KFE25_008785 [Diacronema lutheri]
MKCRSLRCLSPVALLRAMRDAVRRRRCSEPPPPTAHLLGFGFTAYAGADAGAFLAQTFVVFAANAGLFGGKPNKQISAEYKTLVTPAGWAFSIWPLIYLCELAAVAFINLAPASNRLAAFSAPWLAANALQALWALAFAHERLFLAACLLTGIALALCDAVRVLAAGGVDGFERLLVLLPVTLHAGWVCAAALVGWNVALVAQSAPAGLQVSFAFLTLHAALGLALGSLCVPLGAGASSVAPAPFALAIAWALAAIGFEADRQEDIRLAWPLRRALYHTATASSAVIVCATVGAEVHAWLSVPLRLEA